MGSLLEGKRWLFIDLLRAFSVFCVVINHSVEKIYYNFWSQEIVLYTMPSRVFAYTIYTLGRLGVPCFLTITGYLLMDRTYSSSQAKLFWKRNWFHLLVCTWIWFSVYDLILNLRGQSISAKQWFFHLIFLEKEPLTNAWYMPMIIGVYLLIPVIANGLHLLDNRKLLWIVAFFSVYAFFVPCVNNVLGILGKNPINSQIDTGFSGGIYGLYLLLGVMVKRGVFRKIRTWMLILFMLACFVGTIGFQLWCADWGYIRRLWYDFPLLYLLGGCLLELFSRIPRIPLPRLVSVLSRYSFSVYLIHNILLEWLVPWGLKQPFKTPEKVLLVFGISCIASYMCALMIVRIPKIGPYILYIKNSPGKEKRAEVCNKIRGQ